MLGVAAPELIEVDAVHDLDPVAGAHRDNSDTAARTSSSVNSTPGRGDPGASRTTNGVLRAQALLVAEGGRHDRVGVEAVGPHGQAGGLEETGHLGAQRVLPAQPQRGEQAQRRRPRRGGSASSR